MRHIRSKTAFILFGILAVWSISFSANLTVHGGIAPVPIARVGTSMGLDLELKSIAGDFLIPEFGVAYARGWAPDIMHTYEPPNDLWVEEYAYDRWKDYYAAARLKIQGTVPHNPFFFALGVGVGFHYVGTNSGEHWRYQGQLRGHGFAQINLRLTSRDSMFLEIEGSSQLRDLPEPKKFPLGFGALKLGWRFHKL